MAKEEISKEQAINNKLANLNEKEVAVYYETLLKKMFRAVRNNDYLTLGSLEETLKKSIIITASKVKNFSLVYATIKANVLAEELANYIDVAEMEAFNNATIEPEYFTLEEARLIASTSSYKDYDSKIGFYSSTYEEIFENEAYSCILDDSFLYINFKGYNKLDESEIGVGEGCFDWADELAVLKAFVTDSTQKIEEEPSEALKYIQIKKAIGLAERYEGHFQRWENYNSSHELKRKKGYNGATVLYFEEGEFNDPVYKPPLESEIYYNKENDNFIAIIDLYHLVIIDKRNKNRIVIYNGDNEFLYRFCDYCLGIEPKKVEVPEVDPTEENVPTEEGVKEDG